MPVDLDLLLKLRLVVARYGEMDGARWWNTRGQLGSLGAKALQRGFPRTHFFAQARSVFAVATHRCSEVFDPPPGFATLWRLPEALEEDFDARWEHWLDHAGEWSDLFTRLQTLPGGSLADVLREFGLASQADLEAGLRPRRSEEGRVLLPGTFRAEDSTLTLLALGFSRGEPGALAVPYIRREDG